MADRKINLSGLDEKLSRDIEERVSEFERKHEADILRNGAGWVPRLRRIDYAIAILINILIVLWLAFSFIK